MTETGKKNNHVIDFICSEKQLILERYIFGVETWRVYWENVKVTNIVISRQTFLIMTKSANNRLLKMSERIVYWSN